MTSQFSAVFLFVFGDIFHVRFMLFMICCTHEKQTSDSLTLPLLT